MGAPVGVVAGTTHRQVDVGEVTLHVAEAGDGPLVILLHGFPDGWFTWRRQIHAVASGGRRVVAADLRGYGGSSRPGGIAAYDIDRLLLDIDGLVSAFGGERAAFVAHDWGGVIAWFYAMRRPERVDRLAILNSPHPVAFSRALRQPRQWLRSRYMLFFQLPRLPEFVLSRRDFEALRSVYRRDPIDPRSFTVQDIEAHVGSLRQPGAVTAAIDYYRAAFRGARRAMRALSRVEMPVLTIWGERDRYLIPQLATPDPDWVPNSRVVRVPGASHWVHLDAAELVNNELVRFLSE